MIARDETMKKNFRFYIKLFASTFALSMFTFGGGYVIVSLMQKKFVEKLKWIDENEMLDMVALSQSAPGAIAVNASILVGFRLAGIAGAAAAILGTVLPPLIILSAVSYFYTVFKDNAAVNLVLKGMRAGVSAIMIDVVLTMGKNIVVQKSLFLTAVMIISFIAAFVFNVNVMLVIALCGLAGYIHSRLTAGKSEVDK